MKTIKSYLLAAIFLCSFNLSNASALLHVKIGKDPFSEEISKMLSRSALVIEKDFKAVVYFTVSENNIISIRSITSQNETVNEFLQERLNGQQLRGRSWFPGKLYELPVRIKAIR